MRIKRGKKYHKYVNFFRVVYKFRAPFKVLTDGNFFHHSVKEAMDLKHLMNKILEDQPFIFMNKCIMREIENLAELVPAAKATLLAAKHIVKLPC